MIKINLEITRWLHFSKSELKTGSLESVCMCVRARV